MKCSYCNKEIDEEQALKKKNDALKAHHPTVEYYQSGKWFCDENCGRHYFMRMTVDEETWKKIIKRTTLKEYLRLREELYGSGSVGFDFTLVASPEVLAEIEANPEWFETKYSHSEVFEGFGNGKLISFSKQQQLSNQIMREIKEIEQSKWEKENEAEFSTYERIANLSAEFLLDCRDRWKTEILDKMSDQDIRDYIKEYTADYYAENSFITFAEQELNFRATLRRVAETGLPHCVFHCCKTTECPRNSHVDDDEDDDI